MSNDDKGITDYIFTINTIKSKKNITATDLKMVKVTIKIRKTLARKHGKL